MKDYLIHRAQTIQCISVRIILVVAKINGFPIWVAHIKLAYLQSDIPLIKKISIINPAPKLELYPEECPEPLKLTHGLAGSGDE